MAEILPSVYKVGTATVAANGVTVTGQGTLWVKDILPGDFFGVHKGLTIQIESVDSNGSLTLANPWPGAAQNAAPYAIMLQSDVARHSEALRQLLVTLSSGNVEALAELAGAANTLPIFTGAGTMDVTAVSALAIQLLAASSQTAAREVLGSVFETLTVKGASPVVALEETDSGAKAYLVLDAGIVSLRFNSLSTLHLEMAADGTYRWFGNDVVHLGNLRAKLATVAPGEVGSTGLFYNLSAVAYQRGDLAAGSSLVYSAASGISKIHNPVGTMRCLGYSAAAGEGSNSVTEWERIA